MSDPITFPTSTPIIGLPLLIAGQAQKEFFVNQAMCLLDALYPRTVAASLSAPPVAVSEAECFRVTAPASAAWAGREDHISVRIGGDWQFVSPRPGMRLFDLGASQMLVFRSEWENAVAPSVPVAGTVVDTEARAALTALIEALVVLGVLGPAGS